MPDNWQLAESLRWVTRFTVTEDHLKLLRRAWVDSWYESEGVYGGAPGINAKKPYGNSWIEHDIAEILDIPREDWDWANADENPPVEVGERLMRLHVETMVALQIVLATGEFRPGAYARDAAGSIGWRRDENGQ
jgi:hypothetical protein